MTRVVLLAITAAAAAGVVAFVALGLPLWWTVLVALPVGAAALLVLLLSGAYDVDWAPEPDTRSASVCLHASTLADRLAQAAADPSRFATRVQPRLRRLALGALRRAGVDDLADPRAREILGADLHHLVTARDAGMPSPANLAALVRRLEER
jgi:hypothetical protein